MADHRVDHLRLSLSSEDSGRPNLPGSAERFVSEVLEAAGDRLESRWPGRLIFLSRLALRWRISEAELADPSAISRYADEVASSFGDAEPHQAGAPIPAREIVIFRNEAHWWACYLAACRAGNGQAQSWVYEALRAIGASLSLLSARGRDFAVAVLYQLAEAGVLATVVAPTEAETIEKLCSILSLTDAVNHRTEPSGWVFTRNAELSKLVEQFRALPADIPLRALALIIHVEAMRTMDGSATSEEIDFMVSSIINELTAERQRSLTVRGTERPFPAKKPLESPSIDVGTAIPQKTQFGGLFYLLSPAVELEIGEILWKVCLPEGTILGHCVEALLGAAGEGDPAAALFGGSSLDTPLPEVTSEQHHEIAMALLGSLATALPRRSLAAMPDVVLQIVSSASTQVLVAAERASPFVILVWPATNAREVERGIRAFLTAWPRSAPPVLGSPIVAELEGRVRVRAGSPIPPASNLYLPPASSTWNSALLAQVTGTLCHLFCARLGEIPAHAAGLVERYLTVPATVEMTAQRLTVRMPMSRVEIALRRAGLDRDPGWIPWLQRSVHFVFEE